MKNVHPMSVPPVFVDVLLFLSFFMKGRSPLQFHLFSDGAKDTVMSEKTIEWTLLDR
ncbi:MAG: hypothetical protein IGR76_07135 [Synechococcales cyanobacterium T60_A2020_003]|nr:hypothetical protein [Synechococcales cyanobacterium T60_A2020_003]